MERLSDLDELLLRCRSEQSRIYLSEAVAAYRGAAFRATIASTWIAVVFDIVDKIRELSLTGADNARESDPP